MVFIEMYIQPFGERYGNIPQKEKPIVLLDVIIRGIIRERACR